MLPFWQRIFYIDQRSLRVFRIGTGVVALVHCLQQWQDADSLYAELGVLPWQVAQKLYGPSWSLHATHEPWLLHCLFLIQAILTVAYITGWRTRLVAAGLWILMVSLINRNPAAMQGGDSFLRIFMLWSVFLPWQSQHQRVFSWGTVGFVIQIFLVYEVAGIAKFGDTWLEGDALAMALNIHGLPTTLGNWVATQDWLYRPMTWLTVAVEICAPFCLLFPWGQPWARILAILCFTGLHVGIALTMHLGTFPVLGILAFVALWPSAVWDWRLQRNEPINQHRQLAFTKTACLTLLTFVCIANLMNLRAHWAWPQWLRATKKQLGFSEAWYFFAPDPLFSSHWLNAHADTADGKLVDVLTANENPDFNARPYGSSYNSAHWLTYLIRTDNRNEAALLREYLCLYLCRAHNSVRISLYQTTYPTLPEYNRSPTKTRLVYVKNCPPPHRRLVQ